MKIQWSDDKFSLEINTLIRILQILYSFRMDCTEFYYVSEKMEILKNSGRPENHSMYVIRSVNILVVQVKCKHTRVCV